MYLFNRVILLVILALMSVVSCTSNDDIIDQMNSAEESLTLQSVIAQMDTLFDEDGNPIDGQHPTGNIIFDFCFDFVYPIQLIYNTGTTVSVGSMEDLVDIITNSSNDLYIAGIEFPFQVQIFDPEAGQVITETINNEVEFISLLESCILSNCNCEPNGDPVCVEIEIDNQVVVLTYPNECEASCDGFNEEDWYLCDDECQCTDEIDPVCVEINNGEVLEFQNACLAVCAGYTESEFIDCNISTKCFVSEIDVTVGECNTDGTYAITINFTYENPEGDTFDVYDGDGIYFATYNLADLPVTIESYPTFPYEIDLLFVSLTNDFECTNVGKWEVPDCNANECVITQIAYIPGACNSDDTYQLDILDIDVENPMSDSFSLFLRNDELFGTYLLSDLPLQIESFPLSGEPQDYLKVSIDDNNNQCYAEIEWTAPDC